jgi:uncharacterized protein (DUF305 family)
VKALTVAVAAAAALVLGVVLGALLLGNEREPGDQSPEAGFARDMSVHHAQAVELAFIVRDRTDDPEVRAMAYDIINTQRAQIGMFSGWLQQWGLPQTSVRPPMEWTDHGHGGTMMQSYDDMPGMASDADLQKLRDASGVEAEILFLELMTEHHKGGVEMAEAVLPLTDRAEVTYLADTIVAGQQAEIATMGDMLAARS